MVKSKYTFEKRQREIARHKKQEEKAARRSEAKKQPPDGEDQVLPDAADTAVEADHAADR